MWKKLCNCIVQMLPDLNPYLPGKFDQKLQSCTTHLTGAYVEPTIPIWNDRNALPSFFFFFFWMAKCPFFLEPHQTQKMKNKTQITKNMRLNKQQSKFFLTQVKPKNPSNFFVKQREKIEKKRKRNKKNNWPLHQPNAYQYYSTKKKN